MKRGRRKPYTAIGIARMKCIRGCGRRAAFQWQICADGNVYRVVCRECDVALNEMVTRWAWGNRREEDLQRYRKKVLGSDEERTLDPASHFREVEMAKPYLPEVALKDG